MGYCLQSNLKDPETHHAILVAATDCLDDVKLLLRGTDLELLLQEDGCLLIVAVDDLVDNVLPVTKSCYGPGERSRKLVLWRWNGEGKGDCLVSISSSSATQSAQHCQGCHPIPTAISSNVACLAVVLASTRKASRKGCSSWARQYSCSWRAPPRVVLRLFLESHDLDFHGLS